MPALMVLGACLVLRQGDSERELGLDDFYHDYQVNDLQPGEFVARIRVPLAQDGVLVSSQKWSKRFDQDISAVCTAYRLELEGDEGADFRMACGGLAATIKRATNCEQVISGSAWTEATIDKACAALARTSHRSATCALRRTYALSPCRTCCDDSGSRPRANSTRRCTRMVARR